MDPARCSQKKKMWPCEAKEDTMSEMESVWVLCVTDEPSSSFQLRLPGWEEHPKEVMFWNLVSETLWDVLFLEHVNQWKWLMGRGGGGEWGQRLVFWGPECIFLFFFSVSEIWVGGRASQTWHYWHLWGWVIPLPGAGDEGWKVGLSWTLWDVQQPLWSLCHRYQCYLAPGCDITTHPLKVGVQNRPSREPLV